MGKTWQLQEAKARFSELVEEALRSGPQVVTRRGKRAVVVLSWEVYARLAGEEISLLEALRPQEPLPNEEVEALFPGTREGIAFRKVEL
ncbi:type II toxin-antitoxin system Phd/YefM family antitoxin [Thermus amyloliquefaciens]|uniref:type II toxin-antitoxin system Phd/YefM family antitoxin n=1 Tax=Thermus amyloliquefaciens TaxID=1449080 RepID=UPI00056E3F04|nr:type II toxin-antitoxin system Phd/YefM family antitoxin [Thermus amyloliquefaciens]